MKKLFASVALAAALFVPFAFAATAYAGPPTPYKDNVTAEIFDATPLPNNGVRLQFAAKGTATKLGKMTTLGFLNVNLADLSFTGENTLKGANGDEIFLTITGQLTPTNDPGVFIIVVATNFVSGTGRFVGVAGGFSGEGILNATPNFVGSTFAGRGAGEFTSPGMP